MKTLLLLSDTHSKHRQIPLEWLNVEDKENTIVIHAGDISNMGYLNEIEDFCEWYDKLDFVHKLFCAGNHDWGFANKPKEVAEIISRYPSITYLQDDFVIIDGIKIYMTPQTPWFYSWAFNCARNQDEANRYKIPLIKTYWDKIPSDVDILVSHGPVHGYLDMVPNGEFVGCRDLLDTVITRLDNCILSVFGHIHCGWGYLYKHNKTFVNASILNEQYMVANKPILVEFDKENKIATIIE